MPQGQVELCDSVRYFYCPVVKGERAGLVWGGWRFLVSPVKWGGGGRSRVEVLSGEGKKYLRVFENATIMINQDLTNRRQKDGRSGPKDVAQMGKENRRS